MSLLPLKAQASGKEDEALVTIDRFVLHISTVPANLGQTVGLFLHPTA